MQLDIWHISGDGFHFGRHGLELEESGVHFPSDSLFAAVVARMALLSGVDFVDNFSAPFLSGDPPLVISSAFPRAGNVLFFPKLLRHGFQNTGGDTDPGAKEIKQVAYVSEGLFRRLIQGKQSLVDFWAEIGALQHGKVLYLLDEAQRLPAHIRNGAQPIWQVERRPHVTIGRAAQDSTLFHIGRTTFNQDCGLWFAVRWLVQDSPFTLPFETALEELGDAGLGGIRNQGYGACSICRQDPLDLPGLHNNRLWVTLSRYLPKNQVEVLALSDPGAAYTIEAVGGWVSSGVAAAQRRRTVNMLVEGSVLGPLAHDPPGQMVDVQPDYGGNQPLQHPAWRNGIALAVGLQAEE